MLISRSWTATIFFFGMSIQLALPLCTRIKKDFIRLLMLPLLMAMAMFTHFQMDHYGYDMGLLAVLLMTVIAMIQFVDEVMPVLTRYHAAAFTALFWYVFANVTHTEGEGMLNPVVFFLCVAASALSLLGVAAKGRLLALLKPVMYAWYVAASAYVCISQVNKSVLGFLLSGYPDNGPLPGPISALLDGMMCMYVCLSLSLLFDLQAPSVTASTTATPRRCCG